MRSPIIVAAFMNNIDTRRNALVDVQESITDNKTAILERKRKALKEIALAKRNKR